jgi:CRISPR/Cas system-associated exonuclease Cas4 (RecB family)
MAGRRMLLGQVSPWPTRDPAANVRLYRLAAEILAAIEAGVFPPRVGWHCQDCPVRSRCWAWESP